jgi:hypothetical protein
MDGVAAILQLLTADAPLTALVPTARILPGVLPQDTVLPAISIMSVSGNDRNIPAPGADRHVVERVQVTVLAPDYPSQKAVQRAVRKAAADKIGVTVTGISDVTVHTDSAGPDFMNEAASIHMGSQDFRVEYNQLR